MRRQPPERVDEPLRWLRANKHDLGPLTGTDTRALLAIAACWRLYVSSDRPEGVLRAVRELLLSMQRKCWRFAKALIPWAADWSDEEPVWDRLVALEREALEDLVRLVDKTHTDGCTGSGPCLAACDSTLNPLRDLRVDRPRRPGTEGGGR